MQYNGIWPSREARSCASDPELQMHGQWDGAGQGGKGPFLFFKNNEGREDGDEG